MRFGPGHATTLIFAVCGVLCGGCLEVSETEQRKCDLVSNDRCNVGEMCIGHKEERCVPEGTTAVGDACTKHDDCVGTAICASVDGVLQCATKCDFESPDCAAGRECFEFDAGFVTPDNLGFCRRPICNPVENSGCDAGQDCIGGSAPRCGKAGAKKDGEACGKHSDCAAKHVCVEKTCRSLCDASVKLGNKACGPEDKCSALLDTTDNQLPRNQGLCSLIHCNALTDAGCAADKKCYAVSKPICGVPGDAKVNEECKLVSDCSKGNICVPKSATAFICRPKCDLSHKNKDFSCNGKPSCCVLLKGSDGKALPNGTGACGC